VVLPVVIEVGTKRPSISSRGVEEFAVANLAQRKQQVCVRKETCVLTGSKRRGLQEREKA